MLDRMAENRLCKATRSKSQPTTATNPALCDSVCARQLATAFGINRAGGDAVPARGAVQAESHRATRARTMHSLGKRPARHLLSCANSLCRKARSLTKSVLRAYREIRRSPFHQL